MFSNKQYIKFLQKSKQNRKDIVCINILDCKNSTHQKSEYSMFVNSDFETIGFDNLKRLENYILILVDDVLKQKEGRYIIFDLKSESNVVHTWEKDFLNDSYVKCWIEPFYNEDDYGCIGQALQNVQSGINNTLVRSLKYKNAYCFFPNFDEKDNHFDKNKNLFYQRIETPLKLFIFGVSKQSEELVKVSNYLGWHTIVCDIRRKIFRNYKLADELLILDSYESAYKLKEKEFNAVVVINANSNKEYIETALSLKVEHIAILNSNKKVKQIIDEYHMKENIIEDKRVHHISKAQYDSIETAAFKVCALVQNRRKDVKGKEHEFN